MSPTWQEHANLPLLGHCRRQPCPKNTQDGTLQLIDKHYCQPSPTLLLGKSRKTRVMPGWSSCNNHGSASFTVFVLLRVRVRVLLFRLSSSSSFCSSLSFCLCFCLSLSSLILVFLQMFLLLVLLLACFACPGPSAVACPSACPCPCPSACPSDCRCQGSLARETREGGATYQTFNLQSAQACSLRASPHCGPHPCQSLEGQTRTPKIDAGSQGAQFARRHFMHHELLLHGRIAHLSCALFRTLPTTRRNARS